MFDGLAIDDRADRQAGPEGLAEDETPLLDDQTTRYLGVDEHVATLFTRHVGERADAFRC